jgi:hypothetical protein
LGDFTPFVGHKDAPSLRVCSWFEDPLLSWGCLHILHQVLVLIRENVSLWEKYKMLRPMDFSQFGDRFVHQIFPCYVEWAWKVVYFLVLLQLLVNCIFNRAHVPNNWGLAFEHVLWNDPSCRTHHSWWLQRRSSILHQVLDVRNFSESVILKSIPNNFDIALMEVKIVTSIRRDVRVAMNWVLVHSKY